MLALESVLFRNFSRQPTAVVDVKYADIFCLNAFSNSNLSEVFLETENFDLGFGEGPDQPKSDALGALATPSMTVQGISRKLGPVADLANIVLQIILILQHFLRTQRFWEVSI